MRYFVEVEGRTLVVEIVETREGQAVLVDGRRVEADLKAISPDARGYSLLVDGRSHPLTLDAEGDAVRVALGAKGISLRVRVESERERLLRDVRLPASTGPRTISSVMCGIISRVLVAEGDRLSSGAPLLIIEAMKMENEVRAPADGVVQRIHVRERARVDVGDALVTFGP